MNRDRNIASMTMISNFAKTRPQKNRQVGLISSLWQSDLDMGSRKTFPAHLTASAIVLHHNQVLLIKHKFLQRWLFPGGHLDDDESPQEAALRELYEETGIIGELVSHDPVDMDCHPIPFNSAKDEPEHYHIDLKFLMIVQNGQARADLSEVDELKWVDRNAISSLMSHDIDLNFY